MSEVTVNVSHEWVRTVLTDLLTTLVAGALTGYFANLLRRSRAFHRNAVRSQALVTGRTLHERMTVRGDRERYHSVSLRFTAVDGRTISTEIDVAGLRPPQSGRRVRIRYDPRNPRDVRLDTPFGRGYLWQVPALLACASVFVIGLVALVRAVLGA